MAPSSGAAPLGEKATLSQLKDALYARCAEEDPNKRFTTADLLALGVIPKGNNDTLIQCVQALLRERLFQVSDSAEGAAFKVVKREDAARYNNLTQDEEIILTTIEAAGREGIWLRTINLRTNLHSSVVTRAIRGLESKGLVKNIQSVKYPTRKIYILAALTPSEDVTGGPWFTDGELDTEFVSQLCGLLEKYVRSRSFYVVPPQQAAKGKRAEACRGLIKKKRKLEHTKSDGGGDKSATTTTTSTTSRSRPPPPPPAAAGASGQQATAAGAAGGSSSARRTTAKRPPPQPPPPPPNDDTATITSSSTATAGGKPKLLPFPASYRGYPTVREIMAWINSSGVTEVPLAEEHVCQLMDILYYDKMVERLDFSSGSGGVGGVGGGGGAGGAGGGGGGGSNGIYGGVAYDMNSSTASPPTAQLRFRAVRNPPRIPDLETSPGVGSDFTETPCGRCPVFDLCEAGGPVNAGNCVYLEDWLRK